VNIPQELQNIIDGLSSLGARPLLVGGCVRDHLMGIEPKDYDVEVFNIYPEQLAHCLRYFGRVDEVGKSFGVLKVRGFDFSVPRRDNKVGACHKDFNVVCDPKMSVEDACSRRDFTINSMAYDPQTNQIIDPFNGQYDMGVKVLEPTSSAFKEDPLRVLRAFQFSGRFSMHSSFILNNYAREIKYEYNSLPKERVWGEWQKWAEKSVDPSCGLALLRDTMWISLYPELNELIGCLQEPEWHPEGWLRTSSISFNSDITGSTLSAWENRSFAFRELFSSAIADDTTIPSSTGATQTQTVYRSFFNSFFTTDYTRFFRVRPSFFFSPAIIAKSERFMFFGRGETSTTDKIVRIMLKIPNSCMNTIVNTGVDDLQIIDSVISRISVFMMNVFTPFKLSAEMILHDNSVNTSCSTSSLPTGIKIPSRMYVDFTSSTVDGYVKFVFDFCIDDLHINTPIGENTNNTHDYTPDFQCYEVYQGDVWEHTMQVCDAMSEICHRENIAGEDKVVLMLAALCHDLGKPATTYTREDGRIVSPGHAEVGVDISRRFLNSIGCFPRIIDRVLPLVKEHLAHIQKDVSARTVRRLANRLGVATIKELAWLTEADHSGRSPLPGGMPDGMKRILEISEEIQLTTSKPQPILMGKDLIACGVAPGKKMGEILADAFEAQLNGEFTDKDGAVEWFKNNYGEDYA
jgi:putative nucleotidyltransferase with HDIG domain